MRWNCIWSVCLCFVAHLCVCVFFHVPCIIVAWIRVRYDFESPIVRNNKEATHYAGIFGKFLEQHYLALFCIYSRCYQGQRHTYKGSLIGPRRLDYIVVPNIWLAAIAKSQVLEHFDVYTVIYY